jgi:hypothetical protein
MGTGMGMGTGMAMPTAKRTPMTPTLMTMAATRSPRRRELWR